MQGKTPKDGKKPIKAESAKSSKKPMASTINMIDLQMKTPFTDIENSVSLHRAFHNFLASRKAGANGVLFTRVLVEFFDGRSPEIRLNIAKSEATYLIPRKKSETKTEAEQRRIRAYDDFLPMVTAANTRSTAEFIMLLPPSELPKFLKKYSKAKSK